jgi:Protein of unknown function (DUF2793)
MTQSARLGAQFLQAGQAQKEVTVNEGFAIFDLAASAAVDGFLVNAPPASPAIGSSYIVGSSPTGAWTGHAQALAGYTAGGWRTIAAFEGLTALDKASGETATFRSGAWEKGHARAAKLSVGGNQVVGARLAAVADPSGGSTIDTEARAAIAAILARLRQHGLIAS